MFEIIPPHFVESLLWPEDIVDQIYDDETVVDDLDRITKIFLLFLLNQCWPSLGEKEGVHIDD